MDKISSLTGNSLPAVGQEEPETRGNQPGGSGASRTSLTGPLSGLLPERSGASENDRAVRRRRIAPGPDSLRGGVTNIDDEALIQAYQGASNTLPVTAGAHASHLRQLAAWLRANRTAGGEPRPTLGALRNEVLQSGQPARVNAHVQAFRQAVGEQGPTGKHVAGAVDALVQGGTLPRQPQAHVDDEALIQAYQGASDTHPATAGNHASHLRQLAAWLRANRAAGGEPRPTLGALRNEVLQSGQPARVNAHVQAFRQAVGEQGPTGRNVASAVDALVQGGTLRRQPQVHLDDEALIQAYQGASDTHPVTAGNHASRLRQLAAWLRANRAVGGEPRPTLGALRNEVLQSGQPARVNAHVQAFRQAVGERSATGRNVAGAVDALVQGGTLRRPQAHLDDEALIQAYRGASDTHPVTAGKHASHLRQLAAWLRANRAAGGEPRPTLGELRNEVLQSGQPARVSAHVQAFRQEVGEQGTTGMHVAGAVDALVQGGTLRRQPQAHVDDEALIQAYQGASDTHPATAGNYANHLRQLAAWLRANRAAGGEPRPTLGELRNEVLQSGQPARENAHVQAFRQAVGERGATGRNVAGAVDALGRCHVGG
ncbi:hypothetical protein K7N18_38220 [Burkholderia arboris]|uniref:hypothetical protein n=1 Tax=Burkholderia arboris TaxID=488730 RepID=UPI001CA3CE2F|nr:hypothetical protein [Burkholderia arboris]MBY8610652.1 hypothetical protein [Burkholderia arboris]